MLAKFHEEILDKKGSDILAFDARVIPIDGRCHIVEIGLVDLRGEAVFHSLVRPSIQVPSAYFGGELLGIDKRELAAAPGLSQVRDRFLAAAKGKVLLGYCTRRARKVLGVAGYPLWLCRHFFDVRDEFSTYMDEHDEKHGRLRRFSLTVAAMYFEGYEPRALRDEYVDPNMARWFPLRWDYGFGSIYRCRQVVTVARGLAAAALGRSGYRMCAGSK
ncbi:MAG TPA: hypothetical protein PKE16_12740 [Hyphomicrobium sp.]|nr:hypothetical protein [Hyphomicrobium sp.]